MLIAILFLVGALLLGVALWWDVYDYDYSDGPLAVGVTGGVLLFCAVIALIVVPCSRAGTESFVIALEATRQTVNAARERSSEMELAAITATVAEYNSALAARKYWQKNLWIGVYEPAWIQDVEPIR